MRNPNSWINLLFGYTFYEIAVVITSVIVVTSGYFSPQLAMSTYALVLLFLRIAMRVSNAVDKSEYYDGQKLTKNKEVKQLAKEYTRYFPTERIVAFSDGIFAISITLTVVNLRAPEIDIDELTEEEFEYNFNQALLEMWPQYISFGFSLLMIGLFWFWHHKIFSVVKRVSYGLFRFNSIFLSLVATLPGMCTKYNNITKY